MNLRRFLLLPLALLAATASAQIPAPAPTDGAAVEEQVRALAERPGITVVHLWATWCPNCANELKEGGWARFVGANSETQFVFLTVWDDGRDGRDMLARGGVGSQANVRVMAHPGPRKENKIKQFLGQPVGWLPSTWVFRDGKLAYAMNYGEVRFPMLQQMVDDSRAKW